MCLPPVAYPPLSRPYPGANPECEPPRARVAWRARGGARGPGWRPPPRSWVWRRLARATRRDWPRKSTAGGAVGDARRATLGGRPTAEVAALVDAGWATCSPPGLPGASPRRPTATCRRGASSSTAGGAAGRRQASQPLVALGGRPAAGVAALLASTPAQPDRLRAGPGWGSGHGPDLLAACWPGEASAAPRHGGRLRLQATDVGRPAAGTAKAPRTAAAQRRRLREGALLVGWPARLGQVDP